MAGSTHIVQARQLAADTFERIVIYHHGLRTALEGQPIHLDMVLVAKGGESRLISLKRAGGLLSADSVAGAS